MILSQTKSNRECGWILEILDHQVVMADACLRQPLPRQEGRESVSAILDHTVQFLGRFRFAVNRNGIKNLCKCKMSRITLEKSQGDTTLRGPE